MPRVIIAISGPVGAGKTRLANRLSLALGGDVVSTRQVLAEEYHVHERAQNRGRLQELGDQLDRETRGRWVAEAVIDHTKFSRPNGIVIVDAVRRESQIDALRRLLGVPVFHVHVTASERVLTRRYGRKQEARKGEELPSFAKVRANPTEARIDEFGTHASIRLNTGRWRPSVTYFRARNSLGLSSVGRRKYALARAGAAGLAGVAATVVVLLGAPILDVTQLRRTWALIVAYVLLLTLTSLLVAWALSGNSPVSGLPRRNPNGPNASSSGEAQQ